MPMQLTLDFTTMPQSQSQLILRHEGWLDVSDIACGVGFTTTMQISITLHDALEPLQNEIDGDYDQRLYDALWRAYFELSLNQRQSATFNFAFAQKYGKTDETSEANLRIRVELQEQTAFVGLLQDF